MKATKKIVGAACALVAAVALSAGSTFAWFASSNEVSATGMKVQATVPANIYITKGYKTDVADVNEPNIVYADATSSLSPVAISNATASPATGALTGGAIYGLIPGAYKENKKPDAENAGEVDTYDKLATGAVTTNGLGLTGESYTPEGGTATTYDPAKYIYKQDMTLANKSDEVNIDAQVDIGRAASSQTNTHLFIRAGFIIGTESDGAWSYSFTSIENSLSNADGANATTGTNVKDVTSTVTFTYANLIAGFASNTVRTVTFLVWFDGDDTDCFVNNAVSVSEFTIAVTFTVGTATASGD